jgi:hypothetical protein
MDEHLHIYENLLICLMRLELYDEALAVAERGKSRLLIDLLTAQELRPKNARPTPATALRGAALSGAGACRCAGATRPARCTP